MSHTGYLVIADISGYTVFLSKSELEHAEHILRSLLDLLIEHTKLPLRISRLEGDAVISYAPDGSFRQGQTLLEIVEKTYVAFRHALELMILNTTCTCRACANISGLDLKFFVHYGTFVLQPLGNYTELIGSDVNLIHRLTKNKVKERTGLSAYALYTQAAIESLGVESMATHLTPHEERVEHLGLVATYIQDMHPVWKRERGRLNLKIEEEDALVEVAHEFDLTPEQLWEYVTMPEYRAIVYSADSQTIKLADSGRIEVGAVYRCTHGRTISTNVIVEWQPFDQYSAIETTPVPGATVLTNIILEPTEAGTRLTYRMGKAKGSFLSRFICDLVAPKVVPPRLRNGMLALDRLIRSEAATDSSESKNVEVNPLAV